MHADNADNDTLDLLAAEFAARCRGGDRPSIDEYVNRHPGLADDIRELFPTILELETAKSSGFSSTASLTSGPAVALERLGDFRLIREIGRGGMGIVFEAEQQSLGRRVAIKVLPQAFLGDETRTQRFDREARTAAKLHHTNIVPIFGVGEDAGYHYFVMQFIRGVGLDRTFKALTGSPDGSWAGGASGPTSPRAGRDLTALARALIDSPTTSGDNDRTSDRATAPGRTAGAPSCESVAEVSRHSDVRGSHTANCLGVSYWRSLAAAFARAADALAYAHSQDVLHRDIKPGNLLLDTDGTLWVSDFGLAKALEHDELTEVGDVIGTLRYMAPEQFSGSGDARVDVYGLGVTLYELATLKPAFVATERSRLMRAILHEDLTRPRQLAPQMPSDLETIILKATAREPDHRYAAAALLRDDLNRFVNDLPILARRISASERLWRWSRRNPALAATTALVFILLATLASVFSTAYVKVRLANDRTQGALRTATQQRLRAEGTASLAVEALDTIFDELAPAAAGVTLEFPVDGAEAFAVSVADPQLLTPETANLLQHMLEYYRRLAAQHDESLDLDIKIAAAHRRVGQIYERLGRFHDAQDAYETAIGAYRTLLLEEDVETSTRVALAEVQNQLGGVLMADDQMGEAQAQFDEARRVLAPAIDRPEPDPRARYELARTQYLASKRLGPALARGQRRGLGPPAGRGGGEPPGRHRRRPRFDVRRSASEHRPEPPGGGGRGFEQRARRRRQLEEAVTILTDLTDQSPSNPAYLHLLALSLRETHRPRGRVTDWPTADNVDRAAVLLESLVGAFPEVARYRLDLAETYAMQDHAEDAARRFGEAIDMINSLIRAHPNVPSYRFVLGHVYLRQSHVCTRDGNADEALLAMQRGLGVLRALTADFPDVGSFAVATMFIESRLARLFEQRGDLDAARDLLESAARRLEVLLAADEVRPHIRDFAGVCYGNLADVYQELGALDEARKASRRAREFVRPPGEPEP